MNPSVLHDKMFVREFYVVLKNKPKKVNLVRLELFNAFKISYYFFDFCVTVAVAFILERADLNLYSNDAPKTLYFPILAVI